MNSNIERPPAKIMDFYDFVKENKKAKQGDDDALDRALTIRASLDTSPNRIGLIAGASSAAVGALPAVGGVGGRIAGTVSKPLNAAVDVVTIAAATVTGAISGVALGAGGYGVGSVFDGTRKLVKGVANKTNLRVPSSLTRQQKFTQRREELMQNHLREQEKRNTKMDEILN